MSLDHLGDALREIQERIKREHPHLFTPGYTTEKSDPECAICGDAGYIERDGYRFACQCQQAKAEANHARRIIDNSGLGEALDFYTMDSFQHDKPFQRLMLDAAQRFLDAGSGWMYLGGQPGCGKTHLCTAVCGELLKRGTAVRYMCWTQESRKIKAGTMDTDLLDELLEPIKCVGVLYIDDLFKGAPRRDGRLCPSDADVKLAFEILNYRYTAKLRTIISCEWDIRELLGVDQAAFSRVYERCKPFMVYVAPDMDKNYRLR